MLYLRNPDVADVGDITDDDWADVRAHLELDLIAFVWFFCFFKDRNSRSKRIATPSSPQLALLWRIMYLVDEDVPVRAALLKERQGGFSWVICQVVLWRICFNQHLNALHVAHDKKTTNRIFSYLKEGHEWLVDAIRPEKVVDTKGELHLLNPDEDARRAGDIGQDSRTFCDTAGNNFAGTGEPVQIAHASEVGKWHKVCADPETVYTSFANAIQDEPGTFIFCESTAHGAQTFWHEMWLASMKMGTTGWNGFTPVFLPWYLDERNASPAPFGLVLGDREDSEFGNEVYIKKHFGLSDEQLCWRRGAIRKQPETRSKVETFNQEHPATPEIAWLFAHGKWLQASLLEAAEQRAKDQIAKGFLRVRFTGDLMPRRDLGIDAQLLEDATKAENDWMRSRALGPFTVYRWPDWHHDYLVSGDVAEGGSDGDASCAKVWQRVGNESEQKAPMRLCAEWHGTVGEDIFGDILWRLGWMYSTGRRSKRLPALIAWERTGPGHTIAGFLKRGRSEKDVGYPHFRLYRRHEPNSPAYSQDVKYGISTNGQTKPVMMALFMAGVRDGTIQLTQRDIMEAATVTRNDRGLLETQGRDRVMAVALGAFAAAFTLPVWGEDDPDIEEVKEHSVKWTMKLGQGKEENNDEETEEVVLS